LGGALRTVQPDIVLAISVPVTNHWQISCFAKLKSAIPFVQLAIAVGVDYPNAIPVDSYFLDAIAIEVADDRNIPILTVRGKHIGVIESAIAIQIQTPSSAIEGANRASPAPVPISGYRLVAEFVDSKDVVHNVGSLPAKSSQLHGSGTRRTFHD
jgi:hypothetical protein